MLEGNPHPAGVLLECGDRVAEDVLDFLAACPIQQLGQLEAGDLHALVGERSRQLTDRQLDRWPARADLHADLVAGAGGLDLGQDAHPLHDPDRGAPQVDRVRAGRADRGGMLDHGGVEAVAPEPVGHDGPGDPGP